MDDLDAIIAAAIRQKPLLTGKDVGLSTQDAIRSFCDAFAHRVVERYLAGDMSWSDGDNAMNKIFGLINGESGYRTPDFAWKVYLAFDHGEYRIPGRKETSGDEATRPLIEALVRTSPRFR